MKKTSLIVIALLLFIHSIFSQNSKEDSALYRSAVINAMYPAPEKVNTNLVVIDESNPNLVWKVIDGEKYLLAAAWKQNDSYYRAKLDTIYDTANYPVWVTIAPELKERMSHENFTDTTYRLAQLLGLPPNTVYNYFVELWVKPTDLFRPCPDKEITDNQCETCFPSDADSSHRAWINELRIKSYYDCNLYSRYPWTELGYTYDWDPGNPNHFGLSEFVIGKNKKVYVNAIYTTGDYLH